ncbi:MAG: YybH family protein [Chthoniobacteraceae bacterium]
MKIVALAATLTFALASASLAQEGTVSPEETAALANAREYEAAYAKADLKALANFYTDDAEYTAEDGTTASGRAGIEEALRTGLAANRGGKLAVEVGSVRTLAPEVISEKGATVVTSKSGEVSRSLYNAILVKKDGQWKISQLVESPEPVLTPGDRLAELAWLLGEWEESDKTNDLSVQSQYMWARGQNFLSRNVTVKRAGEVTLEGWQVIGWDPVEGRIRTWTFDGEGGFSEGTFTREGNRWLLRETGVAPDGSRTGWENTITKVSDDKFTLESHNRTLNGEPQPGIGRVEINRVKGN